MSSAEFTYWDEWLRVEILGAGEERERWAFVMAALRNGPTVRSAPDSRKTWRADDFLTRRWEPPAPPPKAATGGDARRFIAGLKAAAIAAGNRVRGRRG